VNNNYNSNTVVKQDFAVVKQDFAVVKQVGGRAARMTDTTRHQSWQSPPPPFLPDHAGSIPGFIQTEVSVIYRSEAEADNADRGLNNSDILRKPNQ
jgi:hypothetical protein